MYVLRKCLQNSCKGVYNEGHKLVNKTMYVLLDSYYPRMMFLLKMLIHSDDFCSNKVSKLEDYGLNSNTIGKLKDALNNKKDISPFMLNILSLINLELKSFVDDFKIKFKNLENNCNNCTHSFYRLNFFLNKNRNEKLKLLNYLQQKDIKCNEGPCGEIYKEKIFKKLKISPSKKLINAINLGQKSIAYHINPFISSKKLNYDIKILKKIFFKYISNV